MRHRERRAAGLKTKSGFGAPPAAQLHAAVVGAMRAGNMLEAQVLCRRALEDRPGDASILHLMALVCFNAGQFDHAVEWAARAIRIEPQTGYLTTLGTALVNAGRRSDAVNVFE